MNQNWKDIPGYEGLYQVNKSGHIKALEKRWITGRGNGRLHIQPEKIIKPFISKFGYSRVTLWRSGIPKKIHVHTIVALTFIPNPEGKPQVNHKDGNKLNNSVDNLEWNTASENAQHAYDNKLHVINERTKNAVSERHKGGKNVNAKRVIDIVTGQLFDCIKDAAVANNISVWNLYSYLRGQNPNKTNLRYAGIGDKKEMHKATGIMGVGSSTHNTV